MWHVECEADRSTFASLVQVLPAAGELPTLHPPGNPGGRGDGPLVRDWGYPRTVVHPCARGSLQRIGLEPTPSNERVTVDFGNGGRRVSGRPVREDFPGTPREPLVDVEEDGRAPWSGAVASHCRPCVRSGLPVQGRKVSFVGSVLCGGEVQAHRGRLSMDPAAGLGEVPGDPFDPTRDGTVVAEVGPSSTT